MPPAKVFLSYSHKDEIWKDRLATHLGVLQQEDLLKVWDDRQIKAGAEWQREIEAAIQTAEVAVLLVSADFLTSPFIRQHEIPELLERRSRNGLWVVPVIVRDCVWKNVQALSRLQARPVDGKALSLFPKAKRETELRKIAEEILERVRAPAPPSTPSPVPEPHFTDAGTRHLAETLQALYSREEELLSTGGDPTSVRREILETRRQLREGGRLQPGDFLCSGRFRLLELLGRGGFSTVWKAFDKQAREVVAVKVLHGQHVDDRSRVERFFRGARKMAELHHSGIVRVLEKRLDDGGFHFFVMEYLSGGDLRDAVLDKRLAQEAIVPLLQEVAAALSFAHDRGVVHRDIKPANILLDANGRPKLSDFDLVRAADTTGGTLGGGMLGTFLYSAPEAMSVPQEAGVAADVYSLAMTAAFCLYGADLPYGVLRDAGSFLRKLPCSGGLQSALGKAAAWEPEERFSSVADFAQALAEGALEPEPAPQPPAPSSVPSRRPGEGEKSSDVSLQALLENGLAEVSEGKRGETVLRAVERALPIDADDLPTLGLVAWALDSFPGRSRSPAEQGEAVRLKDAAFAALRTRFPPPPAPGVGAPDWAAIPGGSFVMGSPAGQGHSDEWPEHTVTLSPFRLLTHPVTNREYSQLVTGSQGEADLPVVNVTWYQAYAYAAWLGGRLPTEAEWEYAARGGSRHAYCDRHGSPTTLDKVGWYDGNSGGKLHRVGQLEPNPWGLYDMYGNVWEWVADWFGDYSAEPQSDPWGPPSGGRRVLRGGSFCDDAGDARAAYRDFWDPGFGDVVQGFRVVLPAVPEL